MTDECLSELVFEELLFLQRMASAVSLTIDRATFKLADLATLDIL